MIEPMRTWSLYYGSLRAIPKIPADEIDSVRREVNLAMKSAREGQTSWLELETHGGTKKRKAHRFVIGPGIPIALVED
jgi:hypothetical protein